MNVEVKTKEDYTIVQIGFDDDIRRDIQEKIKDIYEDSPISDFSLHYPFEIDQLEEWETTLDWKEISSNKQVKWSRELIMKFQDKWDWFSLWNNQSALCWDAELLEEFRDKIVWNLIVNTSIHWTRELQGKFEKYLTWSNFKYDYDMIVEHTTRNRNNFFRSPNNNLSEPFLELYLYAKSIDEEQGIFILFDAIQEYFEIWLKEKTTK